MKLSNFSLERPVQTITLIGLDLEWDLHNFADFAELSYSPSINGASMLWRAPKVENPWGCPDNKAIGVSLRFKNLEMLYVSPIRDGMPLSEGLCLMGISKVLPNTKEYRLKEQWEESETFNLLFEFQNGRSFEIASESVELEAVWSP